jgi:hypothetical protein
VAVKAGDARVAAAMAVARVFREGKRILERIGQAPSKATCIKACAHSVGCSLTCAYGTKLKRVLRRADGLGRTNAAAQGRKQVLVGISFPVPSSPRARALFDRPACRRRRWRAWSVAAWPPRRVGRWRAHCVSQHDARDRGPHGPRRGRGAPAAARGGAAVPVGRAVGVARAA